MKQTETVQVHNLSTGYRTKGHTTVVACRINASLQAGELTCLLGPNGVGKSTLLRTLSAFQLPLDGEILLLGKQLTEYTEQQLATRIGVVLTERCDINNMTTEELVGMGRSPYTGFWGGLTMNDLNKVEEAIEWVRIGHLKGRMVQTLSDGERQKVMIAKALAQETPVILLDEPTAFLDYPSKVEIMQLLHDLARTKQKTIFLSTHDLELALQLADRLWLMDKERGVVTGTPEDLSLDGNLEQFFTREGIVFNRLEGLFRINAPIRWRVRLSGEGEYLLMAQKALRRNGIGESGGVELDLHIHAASNGFNVNEQTATSIEEMLTLTRNYISLAEK
ncbi:MAG: ABC transporter ATP-binding protein [Paraprevotella sp.]|nr:ABC transporter ATP-binding protein [Paraprevotella sp.]